METKIKRSFGSEKIIAVDDRQCMKDIVTDRSINDWTEREKAACMPFLNKIKEITSFADNQILDIGITLILINKQFGYQWRTIPFYMFDTVFEWFKNNWFNYRLMIDKKSHFFAMDEKNHLSGCAEYRNWYNSKRTSISNF